MSEYQFVDFWAVDDAVSDKNLKYMRKQSTRAEISKWRFSNEYLYGDFRGNAAEMLRRGYDAHLHFANFGVRKVMFRLPRGLPYGKRAFSKYAIGDCLTWDRDKQGTGGVLTIYPEADADTYDYLDDVEAFLERLLPLREALIGGDLRPLFLAWLACCYDEDAKVPPIPAGLNELTQPLESLAEFFEIPEALIQAAAVDSSPAPATLDMIKLIRDWVADQSKADLQKLVTASLTNNSAAARAKIIAEIRNAQTTLQWPTTNSTATFGGLRSSAGV